MQMLAFVGGVFVTILFAVGLHYWIDLLLRDPDPFLPRQTMVKYAITIAAFGGFVAGATLAGMIVTPAVAFTALLFGMFAGVTGAVIGRQLIG
jgi:hypothetical protein